MPAGFAANRRWPRPRCGNCCGTGGWAIFKFRRQMPIGPYIADFCCPALKLIIELDGGVHVLRTDSDAKRDGWLTAKAGFTVLPFQNEALLRNPAVVFEAVQRHAARQA